MGVWSGVAKERSYHPLVSQYNRQQRERSAAQAGVTEDLVHLCWRRVSCKLALHGAHDR